MTISRSNLTIALLYAGLICLIAQFAANPTSAQQKGASQADAGNYITGVVQGAQGPEAGVWVIAETRDLSTNFVKIVVTEDQGRVVGAGRGGRSEQVGQNLVP